MGRDDYGFGSLGQPAYLGISAKYAIPRSDKKFLARTRVAASSFLFRMLQDAYVFHREDI
jgi:hypothetical protein